jgi:hypothetical protein
LFFLSYLLPKITRPLRRLLTHHNISLSLQDSLSCLRRKLKAFKFIKTLKKGEDQEEKRAAQMAMEQEQREQREARHLTIHESWPQIVPQDLKNKIIGMFIGSGPCRAVGLTELYCLTWSRRHFLLLRISKNAS